MGGGFRLRQKMDESFFLSFPKMSQMNTNSNQARHQLHTEASKLRKELLPLKKRYGHFYIEFKTNDVIIKETIKHQEKRTILSGVIRHTSCPDHSVAYF